MYELTQEERMILSMVDDLCVDVVAERAAAIDEEDEFPQDIYELFVEQGLFALAYGEEHGGVEVSMHCWVQVIERIARESPAVALMILISAIGSDALVFSGSAEQQRAILPALAAGEGKICFALTEPNAGSDISAISTTAMATPSTAARYSSRTERWATGSPCSRAWWRTGSRSRRASSCTATRPAS